MTMSRIQNILDKAERDGTVLRTSRIGMPATATAAAPASVAVAAAAPVSASVPVTIDIPTPPVADAPAVLVPGGPAPPPATVPVPVPPSAAGNSGDAIIHYTVRLNPLLVAGLSPKSLAAEQYRQLRTRLAHAEGAQNLRTVLVTSPQKGEGKSITSANLALTMAQELHRRVLIIEADLRKPSLRHLFGLPAGPGLAEYLSGAAELKDVMRFLPDHNLTVIDAGGSPANPAELLGSAAVRPPLGPIRPPVDPAD